MKKLLFAFATLLFVACGNKVAQPGLEEELSQETTAEEVKEVTDPIVGTYFCNRTHDTYVFKADKTGFFTIQGGSPSTFTWERSGSNVTIEFEAFGEQKLKFDQSAETITEKSESFGTLVFNKQ